MAVVLWTDALIWLLLVIGIGYAWYVRKNEHLLAPWRRVGRSAAGMGALVVLAGFILVALLDSLHYRPRLESKDPNAPAAYSGSGRRCPSSIRRPPSAWRGCGRSPNSCAGCANTSYSAPRPTPASSRYRRGGRAPFRW